MILSTSTQFSNPADEEEIVRAAQGGSAIAVEALVKKHQAFVFHVALKLSRNQQDAADLTQEIFLKGLTKLSTFNFKSSFRTWLYRIGLNHFLSSRRKRLRLDIRSLPTNDMTDDGIFQDHFPLAEQVIFRENAHHQRNRCIAWMLLFSTMQQRKVLILGFVFHIRSKHAAELIGVTPVNFRKLLERAKKDLFNFMREGTGEATADGRYKRNPVTEPDDIRSIWVETARKNRALDRLLNGKYRSLFEKESAGEVDARKTLIDGILTDPVIQEIFQLH